MSYLHNDQYVSRNGNYQRAIFFYLEMKPFLDIAIIVSGLIIMSGLFVIYFRHFTAILRTANMLAFIMLLTASSSAYLFCMLTGRCKVNLSKKAEQDLL